MDPLPKAAEKRNRTIRWSNTVNAIAERLASDKRLRGGVSELLERLVVAEENRKRGIAHLDPLAIHAAAISKSTARRVKIAGSHLVQTSQTK